MPSAHEPALAGEKAPHASTSLTPGELALWLLTQYAPDDGVLNVPIAVRAPSVARSAAEATLRHLVARHPNLRTLFPPVDGAPIRVVLEPGDARAAVDIESVATTDDALSDELRRFAARPFDLARQPPIRAAHFVGGTAGEVLCLVVQHIVVDASALGTLRQELLDVYRGIVDTGQVPARLRAIVQPPVASGAHDKDVRFWRERLRLCEGVTGELGYGRPSATRAGLTGGCVRHPLAAQAVQAMNSLSSRLRLTPSMLLLAVYVLLLSRHGAAPDVVVGVPVEVRDRASREAIAFCANMLAILAQAAPERRFDEWAREVAANYLDALRHSHTSIDEVAPSAYERHDGRQPLLRYMFNFPKQSIVPRRAWAGFEPVAVDTGYSRMNLDLTALNAGRGILLQLVYSDELFTSSEAAALLTRYEELLLRCAEDPGVRLDQLPSWTNEESSVADAVPVDEAPAEAGAAPAAEALVETVAALCGGVLGKPTLPADESFFVHGGTSLLAARLVARLKDRFGVRLSLREVFRSRTPAGIAALVERSTVA